MTVNIEELLKYSLAIVILVAFIAMIVYFFVGLKNKNYSMAKRFAMIYVGLNVLRLILNYFNLY